MRAWSKMSEPTATSTTPTLKTFSPAKLMAAFVALFAAAFLVSFSPSAASAGTASSNYGNFSTAGVAYRNQAVVYTGNGISSASTFTGPTTTTAPSGRIGSQGRLFTSGGTLSCAGAVRYSNIAVSPGGFWQGTSCQRGSGTWYSYGVSYTFNGSGYNATYTLISPNQTA